MKQPEKTVLKLLMLTVISVFLSSSCSTLTKTQTKSVTDYFQTITRFSQYPRELKHFSAKVRMNRAQLFPKSFKTDTVMIETLMSSYEHFQRESQVSESLDSSLKIMEQYITGYYSMTPNGFWFYKMLSSGTSIVDRFLGFGGLMDKATMDAGRNDLIKVGGKKIRNHIINEQELVYQSASQIENFADSILHYALKSEDELLKENYHKFLTMLRKKPDAYEYYAVYNEIFMNDFRLLHHTKKLARQIKKAAAQCAVTHKKLVTKVAARQKLTRGIPELYALLRYINEIEKTLSTLQGIENQYRYDSRSSRAKGY